ncbi:hypothetical protein TGME49_310020 [Toxoplasma gondii ME49]|uniref:Uncharacterized protein n=14 Tax=Toxoplasma gondii TaxID=5811 RepID=B9PJM0_TOXGV|nr:hypothetical protein TGME49_310020 [Toxoplasma gondii ME49]EPR60879.1 hypothetical protein TGGT1_310020 [Toxoplasma gondii GT1]ESS34841.1 hypothetical protein TGVEG_310020 [Toxoplasma gondii VEG]KAF4639180.1 hypothetical protein TGRH88_049520 [Toxoplasma gondii]KFG40780.1 hypothetical protein TGP89_310020 [Toxoplasma gondii p89]KFG44604.1 hypothetical protein TGDOM2_310020 [Toxoplasma gondii GAB2-2007-GAL-DOM2]KFG55773.1 hypothetical protein TGFOU_310020 [Toxoplasma gondii FOU]KFG65750.1 |eukprot:XP_002364248.1 hypothetical protein TGME49_310020 [Toxoplasma gondii ME49]
MIVFFALVCALAFTNSSNGQFNFPAIDAGNDETLEFREHQVIPRRTMDVEAADIESNPYIFREAQLDTPEEASYPITRKLSLQEQPSNVNPHEEVDDYASILDSIKEGVVLEALLPLVTMAPLLVSAGLEADVSWSVPAAPQVSFPKLGQKRTVYMLKCFA